VKLVKLKMLIGHVRTLELLQKKRQNLSHFSCGLLIRHIWIQLILRCVRNIAREGVQNTCHWPA